MAWRWWRDGELPAPVRQTAASAVAVEVPAAGGGAAGVVVHGRVSSGDRRPGLDRQGLTVAGVVREVGCRLDGGCPRLRRILSGSSARVIVVEHRGRLARGGVGHLDAALAANGWRLIVVGPGEAAEDLADDVIGVLASRCARLDGRRGAGDRAMGAVTAATDAELDAAA